MRKLTRIEQANADLLGDILALIIRGGKLVIQNVTKGVAVAVFVIPSLDMVARMTLRRVLTPHLTWPGFVRVFFCLPPQD